MLETIADVRFPVYQTYRYRLYPFRDQERELMRQLDELKFLWNYALEQRQCLWKAKGVSATYADQASSLVAWKANDSNGIARVFSQTSQECLQRLNGAFRAFFRHHAGYPRFKRQCASMTYPQPGNGSAAVTAGRNGTKRLHLSKIGELPIEMHRPLPGGSIRTCTVKREGDRWYTVLTVEVQDVPAPAIREPLNPVGVDLGLNHIATLSTGETVETPKLLRRSGRSLRRAQMKLSRKVKGSNNWHRQKIVVQRRHAKVGDQRRDFAHKLTTGWAQQYDLIAFEDMDVSSMVDCNLAKSIYDAGWGMLRHMCAYKQRNRSHRYVEIPTDNTTQECSVCGRLADPPLTLNDRVYRCSCGNTEDRDVNASRNILDRALNAVGQGMPELTRVERVANTFRKGRRAVPLNREPPAAKEVAF